MGLGDHSDAQLVELARAGWATAFAVLVHRYAPLVHAAVADAEDPHEASVQVFTQAMRELEDRDPQAPVGPWLVGLAGAGTAPDAPRPLTDEELDALWVRLHRRWPTGRPPRRRVPWERIAAVAVLVALAAVVPAIVLGTERAASDDDLTEVRAVPLDEEGAGDDEGTDGADGEADEEPDVTFPTDPEPEAGEGDVASEPTPGASEEPGTTSGSEPDPATEDDTTADDSRAGTEEPSTTSPSGDTGDGTPEGEEGDDAASGGDESESGLLDDLFDDDDGDAEGEEASGDAGGSDGDGDTSGTDDGGTSSADDGGTRTDDGTGA